MLFGIIVRKTKGMKENIVSQAKKKDNIYKSYANDDNYYDHWFTITPLCTLDVMEILLNTLC